MTGFLGNAYLWVKAGHIIFVIFLMAGLFMMPRFFVYHQECTPGSDEDRKWIEREDRLRRIILNPAIIIVWIFGLLLMFDIGAWVNGWFQLKLLIVLALSGYHGWIVGYAKKLKRGERPLTGKQLRMLNEVPGLAAVLAVILAVVKPF
ncbi:CopD family protein [Sphingobium sp. DEHP117]|uniref:CopD family protein n=1 Tax=Sphingobium sp. DEHP117 TaxID=2993436 RepID=UPI0027D6C694|nr:CopD family protein [Sphingobium sp. DEHP117]MDQ4420595.1 CopD family protein [Sphingobium sp. DEHP117]